MNALALRARWVLPVEQPPIANGFVAVADGRIVAVGKWNHGAGPFTDLGDVVLLPGLVNAHVHLEFSALARPLGWPGIDLPAWIQLVIAERKRSDRDPAASIAAGLKESLAAGVTAVGEIATSSAELYARSAGLTTVLFQEAIGFSAGRVDSVFADVERRFDAARPPAGLSPHAPYTVHPQLLQRMVDFAHRRNIPVAMHLAESREELQLLARGDGAFRDLLIMRSMWDEAAIPRGSRPLDYLKMLASAPRTLVVHGNYLAADEIEYIAACGGRMSVVYCPRTHAWFQHEDYPLRVMLGAGVRVVLGTDSRASNPDLGLLDELRFMVRLHPAVERQQALRMATIDAAAALGLNGSIGSLAPGKRADLAAIPCPGHDDPYEAVLADGARPVQTWLAGRPVGALPG
ncbi:MAG: chlorohydrolase [Planctomycetota bacterium]|nr:MAG: chlorohydrolase [Planctomycetota bacterium]